MKQTLSNTLEPGLIRLMLVVVALLVIWVIYTKILVPLRYWNGGDFAGQPVYDYASRITWAAHQEIEACGFSDDEVMDIKANEIKISGGIIVASTGNKITKTVDEKLLGTLMRSTVSAGVYSVVCERP